MAGFHNKFTLRRRWLLSLTLLTFTMTLGVGGILWHSVETSSISEVQTGINTLKPVLAAIRLFLIAMLAMTWPLLINGLHHWERLDEEQTTRLLALRWRVMTWLVVIELVLGQNLLGQVLAVLQGSRA